MDSRIFINQVIEPHIYQNEQIRALNSQECYRESLLSKFISTNMLLHEEKSRMLLESKSFQQDMAGKLMQQNSTIKELSESIQALNNKLKEIMELNIVEEQKEKQRSNEGLCSLFTKLSPGLSLSMVIMDGVKVPVRNFTSYDDKTGEVILLNLEGDFIVTHCSHISAIEILNL